jgi:glycosyltransferase involved in cell wall biosynthesis
MRILVAHNSYQQRGGEDAVVDAEIALLRSFGHEVVELRRDNAQISAMPPTALLREAIWSSSAAEAVVDFTREAAPDLLHVHNTFPLLSPAIYWAAARLRIPVVQTLHNFRLLCAQPTFLREGRICEDCLGTLPWRGVVRKCYRDSLAQSAALVSVLAVHRSIGTYRNKVDRYIALSQFSKRKLVEGGLPAHKIEVKPNFVVAPLNDTPDRSGGLFVGRLSPEKGLHLLTAALGDLPACKVDVVGTGPMQVGLAGNAQLQLLGSMSEQAVLEKMRHAAFLILPSICYEQFPRTLVEAYACGLPIIASRLGSLAELVHDGKTGLLFEAGSSSDLSEKIRFAMANPRLMRDMGAAARAEYEARYTPQENYRQLMQIYADAAHSKQH